MITQQEMVKRLEGCRPGTLLFISYNAGRSAGVRAIEEAQIAIENGINLRHFTGTLESIKTTKRGEVVLTIFTTERSSQGSSGHESGAFRCFNPNLGTMRTMEIIQQFPESFMAL